MNSALSTALPLLPEFDSPPDGVGGGAQNLLAPGRQNPSSPVVQGIAIASYALVLVSLAIFTQRSSHLATEEPLELVMLPSLTDTEPQVVEERPPPIEGPVPEVPPPPVAEEPEPVAPVESKPPPPEKKPLPVKKKIVEKRPTQQLRRADETAASPARPVAPPANAVPSGYANQIFARVSRTAATSSARAAISRGQSARVSYRLVIGPGGQVLSKSITPSGNPTFDVAASEALARAAPFPPTGMSRPVSLSGAIVYR